MLNAPPQLLFDKREKGLAESGGKYRDKCSREKFDLRIF